MGLHTTVLEEGRITCNHPEVVKCVLFFMNLA